MQFIDRAVVDGWPQKREFAAEASILTEKCERHRTRSEAQNDGTERTYPRFEYEKMLACWLVLRAEYRI